MQSGRRPGNGKMFRIATFLRRRFWAGVQRYLCNFLKGDELLQLEPVLHGLSASWRQSDGWSNLV